MVPVQFPSYSFKFKTEAGQELIWDVIRKKWVVITPEEWVRQNFIQYLIQTKKYPSTLIAVEREILVNKLRKRFDILVFNSNHQPYMIVECKSADIKLTETTVHQLLRYQFSAQAVYLIITNGYSTYCWKAENGQLIAKLVIPEFFPAL